MQIVWRKMPTFSLFNFKICRRERVQGLILAFENLESIEFR